METFEHLLYQLHLSYLQARKNKRNTHNQLAFELNQETNFSNMAPTPTTSTSTAAMPT